MKFRPLGDKILVKAEEQNDKTKGGLIIPDTAKEKPTIGKVLATGSGSRNEKGELTPLDVKPGHKVLFGKWAGTEVKIDNETYMILKESDILGILD